MPINVEYGNYNEYENDELYESGSEMAIKDELSVDEEIYTDHTPNLKSRNGKFQTDFCALCMRKKCSFKCLYVLSSLSPDVFSF